MHAGGCALRSGRQPVRRRAAHMPHWCMLQAPRLFDDALAGRIDGARRQQLDHMVSMHFSGRLVKDYKAEGQAIAEFLGGPPTEFAERSDLRLLASKLKL